MLNKSTWPADGHWGFDRLQSSRDFQGSNAPIRPYFVARVMPGMSNADQYNTAPELERDMVNEIPHILAQSNHSLAPCR